MSDHEARSRAVYDHDKTSHAQSGRRRRQVADWGVGEEIFDHMPGRRFERRPPTTEIRPRGGADDGRRTIVIETGDAELPPDAPRAEPADEEFTSREDALRARESTRSCGPATSRSPSRDAAVGRRRARRARRGVRPGVRQHRGRRAPGAPSSRRAHRRDRSRRRRGGRRTVKIGGRPGEFHGSAGAPPAAAHGARAARCAARPRGRVGVRARDPADPDRDRDRERRAL